MQEYLVVRNGGTIVGKEILSGDTEMEREIRKALYPENTYTVVAEAAYNSAADPTGNYLMDGKYHKDNSHLARDIARAKRKEIQDARAANP